jgi:hypothetical protein
MSHQIHDGDIAVARTLLVAQQPEAQIVAALVYRGVEQRAAEQAVDLLKKGKEPPVMLRTTAQPRPETPNSLDSANRNYELPPTGPLSPPMSVPPERPMGGLITSFTVRFGTAFAVDQFGFIGSGTIKFEGEEVTISGQRHWSTLARTGVFLGITVVPYLLLGVGVGLLLALVVIHYFCASYDERRIEKSTISSVTHSKKKISFRSPNDAGKLVKSLFRTRDVESASGIERLLSPSARTKNLAVHRST